MSLGVFIIRRLLFSLLVLLIVSIVVFIVVQVLPGDVASMILGTDATPEDVATMRETLGLNRPAHIRYLEWIGGAGRGDLGTLVRLNPAVAPLVLAAAADSGVPPAADR